MEINVDLLLTATKIFGTVVLLTQTLKYSHMLFKIDKEELKRFKDVMNFMTKVSLILFVLFVIVGTYIAPTKYTKTNDYIEEQEYDYSEYTNVSANEDKRLTLEEITNKKSKEFYEGLKTNN
jgi:preprotein translocase subunit SecG